jgi:hypothetical protein
MITSWSPIHLRTELDRYLWKDGQPLILVKRLWDYFATYCYLPRLKDRDVLMNTIRTGAMSEDFFGYATNVTDDGKYEGLAFGQTAPSVYFDDTSVVVRKEIAEAQKRQSVPVPKPDGENGDDTRSRPEPTTRAVTRPKRFHGTVRLNALKLGSSAGRIGDEVIQHLQALMDANVDVTLEISALVKDGVPEDVVRTILENARVLKFENAGFEEE